MELCTYYTLHSTFQRVCRVPNALPGRGSVNVEIFGMAGVPDGAAPGITVPVGMQMHRGFMLHLLLLPWLHVILQLFWTYSCPTAPVPY